MARCICKTMWASIRRRLVRIRTKTAKILYSRNLERLSSVLSCSSAPIFSWRQNHFDDERLQSPSAHFALLAWIHVSEPPAIRLLYLVSAVPLVHLQRYSPPPQTPLGVRARAVVLIVSSRRVGTQTVWIILKTLRLGQGSCISCNGRARR